MPYQNVRSLYRQNQNRVYEDFIKVIMNVKTNHLSLLFQRYKLVEKNVEKYF